MPDDLKRAISWNNLITVVGVGVVLGGIAMAYGTLKNQVETHTQQLDQMEHKIDKTDEKVDILLGRSGGFSQKP